MIASNREFQYFKGNIYLFSILFSEIPYAWHTRVLSVGTVSELRRTQRSKSCYIFCYFCMIIWVRFQTIFFAVNKTKPELKLQCSWYQHLLQGFRSSHIISAGYSMTWSKVLLVWIQEHPGNPFPSAWQSEITSIPCLVSVFQGCCFPDSQHFSWYRNHSRCAGIL